MYVLKCSQFENSLADTKTLPCCMHADSDGEEEDGSQDDDLGMDTHTDRNDSMRTVMGGAHTQGRGEGRQRKGKGHQSAMQGEQHAGRGGSRGGDRTAKRAAQGGGNNGRGSGRAGRGASRADANIDDAGNSSA